MSDIQISDDTIITNNTLRITYPSATLSLGAALVAGLCFVTAFFMLRPLVQGTHPDMPRTFLVGIGGSGLAWGLYSIYTVLAHRTRTDIDMNSRRLIEEKRKFGRLQETDTSLAQDAVIKKEVSDKLRRDPSGRGDKLRTNYIIDLKSGSKILKLYDGFNETEAQEIVDFFGGHGVDCVKARTTPNKWVIIGTLLFMAALFAELNSMGSLD